MSELKCPFCNKKLEPIDTSGQFQCGTWGCDASFNFIATRDVWEYIDRTKKKLDRCLNLAEEMLIDIEDEGMCSSYYEEELHKIKDNNKDVK